AAGRGSGREGVGPGPRVGAAAALHRRPRAGAEARGAGGRRQGRFRREAVGLLREADRRAGGHLRRGRRRLAGHARGDGLWGRGRGVYGGRRLGRGRRGRDLLRGRGDRLSYPLRKRGHQARRLGRGGEGRARRSWPSHDRGHLRGRAVDGPVLRGRDGDGRRAADGQGQRGRERRDRRRDVGDRLGPDRGPGRLAHGPRDTGRLRQAGELPVGVGTPGPGLRPRLRPHGQALLLAQPRRRGAARVPRLPPLFPGGDGVRGGCPVVPAARLPARQEPAARVWHRGAGGEDEQPADVAPVRARGSGGRARARPQHGRARHRRGLRRGGWGRPHPLRGDPLRQHAVGRRDRRHLRAAQLPALRPLRPYVRLLGGVGLSAGRPRPHDVLLCRRGRGPLRRRLQALGAEGG
ncbi:MAG: hypothetical protein AVDCRST_MAG12-3763, partial [uncultured Rubrobacteraceae bacterium]